jgi:hypothetical protein
LVQFITIGLDYIWVYFFYFFSIGIHSLRAAIYHFHPFPHFAFRLSQVFENHRGE